MLSSINCALLFVVGYRSKLLVAARDSSQLWIDVADAHRCTHNFHLSTFNNPSAQYHSNEALEHEYNMGFNDA